MYERSAIVLERYFDNLLNYRRECNLRDNYNNYCGLVEKLEKYQINYQKELAAAQEYNKSFEVIKEIQLAQKKLYKRSAKLEYDRNLLFNNLDGKVEDIRRCIEKIEEDVQENNAAMVETKERLLGALDSYNEKKFELSKCKRYKKMAENDYNELYEIARSNYEGITSEDVSNLKAFAKFDDEEDIIQTLLENGKNEKIPFNTEVIKCVTRFGLETAKKEAASYLVIYDKMTKLLSDIENGTAKINLHKKYARNEKAKIDFVLAVKEYEVQFLDYERMTVIHGTKSHNRLMGEACENFDTDTTQIDNLYDLLLREISNKATKKAYKELYNKSYLTDIRDKEERFKREKNRVNLNTATLINSNYWRIEGIRGIYSTFYETVSETFGRDIAEFDIPRESDEAPAVVESLKPVEEQKEEVIVEVVEKIPFQIDGYEEDDEDIDDEYAKMNFKDFGETVEEIEEEAETEEYMSTFDDDETSNNNITSIEELISNVNSTNNIVTPDVEEFDIFGDKYKEIDFTEANVVAAKSKVEEEMNFSDKKITRKISKPQNKSVFKEIAFEENGLPYEEEEQEVQLFDDWKKAQRKNSGGIEDFEITKETAKKSGGLFNKFKKGNKKNNFTDDIW